MSRSRKQLLSKTVPLFPCHLLTIAGVLRVRYSTLVSSPREILLLSYISPSTWGLPTKGEQPLSLPRTSGWLGKKKPERSDRVARAADSPSVVRVSYNEDHVPLELLEDTSAAC